VCATVGARVVATDLPDMIEDVRENATRCNWPQKVWRVVGGMGPDGIPVTKEKGGMTESVRLSIGALVEELEMKQEINLMHYRRLTGSGPEEGWVKIKMNYGGKNLLVPTDERPPPKAWTSIEVGRGSVLCTGLRWGYQEARDLMKRVDELEAAARGRDVKVKKGVAKTEAEKPAAPTSEWVLGRPAQKGEDPDLADYVLCSDCVCEPIYGKTWEELIPAVEGCLAFEGKAYISVKRRKGDGIEKFEKRLAKHMRYEKELARKPDPDEGGGEVEVYICTWPSRNEFYTSSVDQPLNPRLSEEELELLNYDDDAD